MNRGTRCALRAVPLAVAIALTTVGCAAAGAADAKTEQFCAAVRSAELSASQRYPAPNTDSREYSREEAAVFAELAPIRAGGYQPRRVDARRGHGPDRRRDGHPATALSDLLAPSDRYGRWLRRHCPGVPSS